MDEPESTMLVQLTAACRALAEARTVQEVKTIRDQAEAVQHYLKVQGAAFQSQQDAAEVKLRAERLLGELLAEMPKNKGAAETRLHSATASPSYAEQGIEKTAAHRWQCLAKVPTEDFESHVVQLRDAGKEITTAGALRLAKKLQQPGQQETPTKGGRIEDLHEAVKRGLKWGTIYADPPWQYGNQGTRAATDNHYPTMDLEAITALPVADLVTEKAHLHLWTTNGFLPEALQLIEAWGFEYRSLFIWCKPQMGLGNYWRVSAELLLLGVRGSCPFRDQSLMNWAIIDRGEHSSKPEQVRLMIERASPCSRLELFARQRYPGWDAWGHIEPDLFSHAADQAAQEELAS
jgi:N6-adenosine-specific RNA methylase IME4